MKLLSAVALLAAAGFAYYALSPFFISVRMDEAVPVIEPAPAASDVPDEEPVSSQPVALVPTPAHPASGTARIVSDGDTRYLRYENFKTLNGPDLHVYLAKDLFAKEFISLGRLKATEGNVNYEIPADVDPSDYPYALVWCKAFSVLFNSAKLY